MRPDMKNIALERMKNGERLAGCWLHTGNMMCAEVVAQCGFDIIVPDLEHGLFDLVELSNILAMLEAYPEITTIVRAPGIDPVWIKKILDVGAQGIHVPFVCTKEETELSVKSCYYPPLGIRGVAGMARAQGYGRNRYDYLNKSDDMVMSIVAIEDQNGIDNLDAMMDVPNLDGIFIGPNDLATNIGHPFDPSHPDVQEAIKKIEKKVLAKGLILGSVANGAKGAEALYDRGYNYLLFDADAVSLRTYLGEEMAIFNSYKDKFNK